ncbi:MAG TPA: DUF4339 domain-containing protein [Rhizomicrobium sp.]|jgi:hypothetical protein|nr:DUF4339 domain-containing protein [Rhizomicrobium sp.]
MTQSWTINAGGRLYGPYNLKQMEGFRAENRLAHHSLVSRAGEGQFRPAAEHPELRALFQPAARSPEAAGASEPTVARRFGSHSESKVTNGPGHFVIVSDMKSGSIPLLEEAIHSLGQAHRLGPQAWVLSAAASVNVIRNKLIEKLGKLDTLFIVDAVHDKAAWFNFGPETDTRIRKMWSRPAPKYAGPERRKVKRG